MKVTIQSLQELFQLCSLEGLELNPNSEYTVRFPTTVEVYGEEQDVTFEEYLKIKENN